jgi:predicted DNA-binding ribbon-helix-helix protein
MAHRRCCYDGRLIDAQVFPVASAHLRIQVDKRRLSAMARSLDVRLTAMAVLAEPPFWQTIDNIFPPRNLHA